MTRFLLPAVVFVLFVLEGTWFQIFVPAMEERDYTLVPRFVLIAVVLISIFRGPGIGVLFGVTLGVLYDFVYTDLLGIYMFSLGFVAYISAFTYTAVRISYLWQMVIILSAIFIFEWMTYGLYYVIGYTDMLFEDFFLIRLVPSWILNGAAALLLLYPFQRLFRKLDEYEALQQR
ncbi:rod shape-determining protein MreD [Alteribacillus persepolensis]|uniref:Rod shape-determining protein MreD n=1 Tax=Alteribacillus persepolensis TaxID=568899 RepID=A0A1G8GP80_9BACI|nr:rod shape-determining protein MreD [Alteribacillus persepolensis]SDH96184.1 rod shape-determining protein MreD [Alteribacillus persepolensis]